MASKKRPGFDRATALRLNKERQQNISESNIGGHSFEIQFVEKPNISNQKLLEKQIGEVGPKSLQRRVEAARSSGILNLRDMGLANWPEAVLNLFQPHSESTSRWFEVVDLHTIDISGNSIRAFPPALCEMLPSVSTLIIDNNGLTDDDFPHDFFTHLPELIKLSLKGNKLTKIPESLKEVSLRHLILDNNNIQILPRFVLEWSELGVLSLSKNQLQQIEFSSQFHSPNPSSLSSSSTWSWNNLSICNLSHNRIPDSVAALIISTISNVSASNNSDVSVQNLRPKLTTLDLSHNQITRLPPLDKLTALTSLNLSFNQLTSIPTLPSPMPSQSLRSTVHNSAIRDGLMFIDVSFNQLTCISPILQSSHLTSVLANDNRIKSLPVSIHLLSHLQHLNVDNNDLADLPPALGLITSLTHVHFQGNYLRKIPRGKMTSTNSLKVYLRSRIDEDDQLLSPALLVFEGGVSEREGVTRGEGRDLRGNRGFNRTDDAIQTTVNCEDLELKETVIKRMRTSLYSGGSKLDLSGLGLSSIPRVLFDPQITGSLSKTGITHLDLSNNNFGEYNSNHASTLFDVFIGSSYLRSVTHLSLSHNRLSTIPEGLFLFSRLRELNLQNNLLNNSALDFFIHSWNNQYLTSPGKHSQALHEVTVIPLPNLILAHNSLANSLSLPPLSLLPSSTSSPSLPSTVVRIEELDLSHNKLRQVQVADVWGLSSLNLANNLLTHSPVVAYYSCPERTLPCYLSQGSNGSFLRYLSLKNNNIDTQGLSYLLAHPKLHSLSTLLIEGNPIRGIRVSGGESSVVESLRRKIPHDLLQISSLLQTSPATVSPSSNMCSDTHVDPVSRHLKSLSLRGNPSSSHHPTQTPSDLHPSTHHSHRVSPSTPHHMKSPHSSIQPKSLHSSIQLHQAVSSTRQSLSHESSSRPHPIRPLPTNQSKAINHNPIVQSSSRPNQSFNNQLNTMSNNHPTSQQSSYHRPTSQLNNQSSNQSNFNESNLNQTPPTIPSQSQSSQSQYKQIRAKNLQHTSLW